MIRVKAGYFRTSQIAEDVGVHPNTVRKYEQWGFLPAVSRSRSGYRLFTDRHRDHMRLARMAMQGNYPGRNIRRSAFSVVRHAATGDLSGALGKAKEHLAIVRAERAKADEAAAYLELWAQGNKVKDACRLLLASNVISLLEITPGVLRHWERNRLIETHKDLLGRRIYGPSEVGRARVIHMLSSAGYSTMAILRMLRRFDQGDAVDLRQKLDTPDPDEDVFTAADRWLSELARQEQMAANIITHLEEMLSERPEKSEAIGSQPFC